MQLQSALGAESSVSFQGCVAKICRGTKILNEVISKFKKALKHSVQVVLDEKDSDECAI